MGLDIVRIVGLMMAHRGRSADDRLLARLDRSVMEARELCDRAQGLGTDDSNGAIADAFQTTLAQPARDWLRRAEAIVESVRAESDEACGMRAMELRVLIDNANAAMMRLPNGRLAWGRFYRSVLDAQDHGR